MTYHEHSRLFQPPFDLTGQRPEQAGQVVAKQPHAFDPAQVAMTGQPAPA